MRVLAAMSGGVDSAVAAARAVEAGHDVVGVHLALSRSPQAERTGARGCCTVEDSHDARRSADVLGIPFYVWDLAEQFQAAVVDDFVAEYAAGRTPNPCVRCNERVKFAALLDKAVALGFDALCTGHYARVDAGGLHRAADPAKDQSYVLAVLTPAQLRRAVLPLGRAVKDDVRAEAARRGLPVAAKPDSYDICFVPDGDTAGWLADRLGPRPGQLRGEDGELLGTHGGAYAFTVGQRKGLRIGRPAPDGRPRYVLDVQPVTGTVTVGPAEALDVTGLHGTAARWCGPVAVQGDRLAVQVRAHGEAVPCTVAVADDGAAFDVALDRPLRGVAPGQTAVLYDGDRVVGSATIAATSRAGAPLPSARPVTQPA